MVLVLGEPRTCIQHFYKIITNQITYPKLWSTCQNIRICPENSAMASCCLTTNIQDPVVGFGLTCQHCWA